MSRIEGSLSPDQDSTAMSVIYVAIILIASSYIYEQDPVTLLLQDDVHPEVVGGFHSKQFKLTCNNEGLYTVQSAPGGINVQ